jgi:hypothetical protein
MRIVTGGTYEGDGVLRVDKALALPANTRVHVVIQQEGAPEDFGLLGELTSAAQTTPEQRAEFDADMKAAQEGGRLTRRRA